MQHNGFIRLSRVTGPGQPTTLVWVRAADIISVEVIAMQNQFGGMTLLSNVVASRGMATFNCIVQESCDVILSLISESETLRAPKPQNAVQRDK